MSMDRTELDKLLRDVEELKRAVRRNSPFLRELVATEYLHVAGIVCGALLVALCAAGQILMNRSGSLDAMPPLWRLAVWIALGLFLVVGTVLEWAFFTRRARQVEEGASFVTVFRAIYGGSWLHLNLPAIICMILVPVAAVLAGHPWYIVPAVAIFYAFPCNSLGLMTQRPEYLALGWFVLAAGLGSLFFLERAPFLWAAIIWGGGSLLFGLVGLALRKRGNPS